MTRTTTIAMAMAMMTTMKFYLCLLLVLSSWVEAQTETRNQTEPTHNLRRHDDVMMPVRRRRRKNENANFIYCNCNYYSLIFFFFSFSPAAKIIADEETTYHKWERSFSSTIPLLLPHVWTIIMWWSADWTEIGVECCPLRRCFNSISYRCL